MTINEMLNDYVNKNGIKQVHIAQKTGIAVNIISKMLKGNRKIQADEFLRICTALNIDPNIFRSELKKV